MGSSAPLRSKPRRLSRLGRHVRASRHPATLGDGAGSDPGAVPPRRPDGPARAVADGRTRHSRRPGGRTRRCRPPGLRRGPGLHARRDRAVPDREPRDPASRSCARHGALHRHRRLDGARGRARRPALARAARTPRPDGPARGRAPPGPGGEVDRRRPAGHLRRSGAGRPGRCRAFATPHRRSSTSSCASESTPGSARSIGEDLGGIGVHIAARIESAADPGEVLVSSTVRDLVVGSGLRFEDRGEHDLKGVPMPWRLLALSGDDEA